MELETTITSVDTTDTGVLIRWSSGHRSRLHALWLRDNCPSGGDREKAFRTFSVVDLNPDLFVIEAGFTDDGDVSIEYSDGHVSVFDPAWLAANDPEPVARRREPRRITHVRAGVDIPRMALPDPRSLAHLELLNAVAEYGAVLVDDVPLEPLGTEALAALIGRVRETDFGRIFDIVVEPDVWEFSQTGLALDPHTDDPYRYTPSGTSLLHCIDASSAGGDTILVDGFAVASQLEEDDPDAFDLLTEVSVPFVRHRPESVDQGEDVHLVAHAPIISLDRDREVAGIRFHERSMGTLDVDPSQMGDYYRALIEFAKRINDPMSALQFRLESGQAIVYDNQRMLHGRTAFGPEGGRRHLRLCTIDRDQFHSRLRRLRADHDRPGVDERLPSGSLS